MAPSSVKGLKGYGIFTTRDIDTGSNILSAPDSPSIPVLDYRDHESAGTDQWIGVFSEYWWTRGVADHVKYEAYNAADAQMTFGALPNHHCVLDSLNMRYPETPYDDSLVNRKDPGAGAFSYNMGREWIAGKDLKAGDEVFLNYGYCEHNPDAKDWTAHVPMPADYEEAADIVWDWLKFISDDTVTDVTIPQGTEPLVAALLPETLVQLQDIVERSNIQSPEDLIPLLAKHVASTPRTPDWIRSNGMCLEHLVPRKSQMAHAGQGAFTQHHISKGEIVVPAPMLQATNKDALMMYDSNGNPDGWQLLLNYCFSHHESSMLLCPATNAGLINHCSNRKKECGPDGPNAMVRWSTGWDPTSDEWRKMTIDEIANKSGRGLSMEIVALRDIQLGEEVFIDYGEEWEDAWEEHVAKWKEPSDETDEDGITAKEANEQEGPLELLVSGDLRKVPEHPRLFTGCRYYTTNADRHRVWNRRDPSWREWDDDEILKDFSDDGSRYEGNYSSHGDNTYWPCSILREEKDGSYTVRIHQAAWASELRWHRNDLPRLLSNYPRDSIHYFVQPYASDHHLSGVFRQPIGIPDEIFPKQWKNRKEQEWVVWKTS